MNNKRIRVALALLIAGLILFGISAAGTGFDFRKLNTSNFITSTYGISEEFDRIDIEADTDRISLAPAENGQCSVTFFEEEHFPHTATVIDGTLTIRAVKTKQWYEQIGFHAETPVITLLLPKAQYDALIISSHTGDIEIPAAFTFGAIQVRSSTSDVDCRASALRDMEISLTTGNITLSDLSAPAIRLSVTTGSIRAMGVNCPGDFTADVSTGSVTMNDVHCVHLSSCGSTGSMTLKDVTAGERIHLERSTGSVCFDGSDAGSIFVKTSTGSVCGTLRTGKTFVTHTSTGSVSVPEDQPDGGACEISTSTGNIDICIQ